MPDGWSDVVGDDLSSSFGAQGKRIEGVNPRQQQASTPDPFRVPALKKKQRDTNVDQPKVVGMTSPKMSSKATPPATVSQMLSDIANAAPTSARTGKGGRSQLELYTKPNSGGKPRPKQQLKQPPKKGRSGSHGGWDSDFVEPSSTGKKRKSIGGRSGIFKDHSALAQAKVRTRHSTGSRNVRIHDVVDLVDSDDDDDNDGADEAAIAAKAVEDEKFASFKWALARHAEELPLASSPFSQLVNVTNVCLGNVLFAEHAHIHTNKTTYTFQLKCVQDEGAADAHAADKVDWMKTSPELIKMCDIHTVILSKEDSERQFIALHLVDEVELVHAKVGTSHIDEVNPSLDANSTSDCRKYVAMLTNRANVELFQSAVSDTGCPYREACDEEESANCLLGIDVVQKELFLGSQSKSGTPRRSTRRTHRQEIGSDPEDAKQLLVYPMEEDSVDAVTLTKGDKKRLAHGEYLNDSLIDFRIKYMLDKESAQLEFPEFDKIHIFSCLFYTKLMEGGGGEMHDQVKRWTRNVDLFSKDFVFVPINESSHWSLVVIVRPGKLLDHYKATKCLVMESSEPLEDSGDEENEESKTKSYPDLVLEGDPDKACILHFDSLGMHKTKRIADNLKLYLDAEWKSRQHDVRDASQPRYKVSSAMKLVTLDNLYSSSKMQAFQVKKMPRQENGFDCGVFVIRFVEMFLRSNPRSNQDLIDEKMKGVFDKFTFSQGDILEYRSSFKQVLITLELKWRMIYAERKEARKNAKVEAGTIEAQEQQELSRPESDACAEAYGGSIQTNVGTHGLKEEEEDAPVIFAANTGKAPTDGQPEMEVEELPATF